MPSHKFIEPVNGGHFAPAIRGLVEVDDDIGDGRVSRGPDQVVLNLLLGLGHNIQRSIFILPNGAANLSFQILNGSRCRTRLYVGRKRIDILEMLGNSSLVAVCSLFVSEESRIQDLLSGDDGTGVQNFVEPGLDALGQKFSSTLPEFIVDL